MSSQFFIFQLQALAIILLNRDLTPRPDLTHSQIIMDTNCGYISTAIGKVTSETVADIVSYFAQAAQSGDGPTQAYEAPMTVAEIRERSMANVLSNEKIKVTLISYYFTPAKKKKEEAMYKEINNQIIDNAKMSNHNRDEMELALAAAPGGTYEERNARINAVVARQRARAERDKQRQEKIFGKYYSLSSSPIRGKKRSYPSPPSSPWHFLNFSQLNDDDNDDA